MGNAPFAIAPAASLPTVRLSGTQVGDLCVRHLEVVAGISPIAVGSWPSTPTHPAASIFAAEGAVAIAVHPLDLVSVRLKKLCERYGCIAVCIQVLKPANNAPTFYFNPKVLELGKCQLAISVGIVFCQEIPASRVKFGLSEFSVFICVETLHQPLEPMTATVMLALVFPSTIVVVPVPVAAHSMPAISSGVG